MDADILVQKLRQEPQHLRELVTLAVDDLLERPVEELVDPAWLAERITEGFRASTRDPQTKEWIRARLEDARERLDQESGPLLYKVPTDLVNPIKDLLRRPYEPDPVVLRALIDHRATRGLFRDVLTHTITDYAKSVKMPEGAASAIKSTGLGRSRLAAWAGAAKVAAEMVGSEVEKRMEGRVQTYVDKAIGHAIELTVEHACDPKNTPAFADMRADAVDVLLAFPVDTWRKELDRQDMDGLIDDLHAALDAVVHSEAFGEQVASVLELTVQEGQGRTARAFLSGSGLEETWRESLEQLLDERASAFVQTPAFEGWLRQVLAD
jgi:hypothetical protein